MAKRGPKCLVCSSPHRAAIELGLCLKVPMQVLGDRYTISRDAIFRHQKSHLSPGQRAQIMAAQKHYEGVETLEKLKQTETESLVANFVGQRARLVMEAETALGVGDFGAAAAFERLVIKNLETVGRVLGQFATTIDVRHVSLVTSPDYLKLRKKLIEVLREHPEIAQKVARAFSQIEKEAVAPTVIDAVPPPPILPPPRCNR